MLKKKKKIVPIKIQTSRISLLIPRLFRAKHRGVLIGNAIGKASLCFINSANVICDGMETFRQSRSKFFVSSSKGTPFGAPKVFSHEISGGSLAIIGICESSCLRCLCK